LIQIAETGERENRDRSEIVKSRDLAFSLTPYANQGTHNDEIVIRIEGKAERE